MSCTACGREGHYAKTCDAPDPSYRARTSAESQAQRYHELKAAGLCVTCGRNTADKGRVRCDPCTDRLKQYRAEALG